MKALSIQPFYATMIAIGAKFIELRTWKTDYRGWLLICSSSAKTKMEKKSMVSGHAVAIAELTDIRPFNNDTDRDDAFLYDDETFEGYSWIFDRVVAIKPFPIKGKLHLYDVEQDMDDLEPIELDYESDTFALDLLTWWKDNGYIENLDLLEPEEE